MKRFTYTVSDPQGLHARNAISLCRLAEGYESQIAVCVQEAGEEPRKADCKNIIALMGLRVHQDTAIEIAISGPDEDMAAAGLSAALPTIL